MTKDMENGQVMVFRKPTRNLTREQALFIYEAKGTKSAKELATQFNVAISSIRDIWTGRSHSDVTRQTYRSVKKVVNDIKEAVANFKGQESVTIVFEEGSSGMVTIKRESKVTFDVTQNKGNITASKGDDGTIKVVIGK